MSNMNIAVQSEQASTENENDVWMIWRATYITVH